MNTFRCSNCGFQIQRPTQPFSCPQCGRQAIGLFRMVAFTPPAQGGWPGQAAQPMQPGMQPGMPQQPGWPQQPGVPQQPGMMQPGMPQPPGMQPGMPQAAPGGWPGQPQMPQMPQMPQPPANLWGQAPGARRCRNNRPRVVGPSRGCRSQECHNSRGYRSGAECRSRAAGRHSRSRPIPGVNHRRRRRCRNSRLPAVGRGSRACRSSRVYRSKACRRRRPAGPVGCSNRRRRHGPHNRRWASHTQRIPGLPRYPQPPTPAMPQPPPFPQPPAQGLQPPAQGLQPPAQVPQPPQQPPRKPAGPPRQGARRRSGEGARAVGLSTPAGPCEAARTASAIAFGPACTAPGRATVAEAPISRRARGRR